MIIEETKNSQLTNDLDYVNKQCTKTNEYLIFVIYTYRYIGIPTKIIHI
jgi:hypothetical protein